MKKIILLLASYVLCLASVFSQEIEWQNTIGGNQGENLHSIQQTSDGGYILGAESNSDSSADKTENCRGYLDYWPVKLDSFGNIQWQNTIGGNQMEHLHSIQQTADAGYILGGDSRSNISGEKTENSLGGADYWVVKLDATGNIQWQNTIGGNNDDYLNSIQQTTDGGYILGGTSASDSIADKTENSSGFDYWVVKLNTSGNIQWQSTIGGNGGESLESIQQTADGGYILGGTSSSDISGDKTENNWDTTTFTVDYWVVKLTSSGNIQWQNTIGGTSGDILNSVHQTIDGGYILGGYSSSGISGDKTESGVGGDYWVVKLTSSGNIQWQNTIGGNNFDGLYSIYQTLDGGYILGGFSTSDIVGDKTENNLGGEDCWVVKLDTNGNILWQNTIGGTRSDVFEDIRQTFDGGYILGGESDSDISGDKSENHIQYRDCWVVKLTDKYNTMTGKLFLDPNNNQLQDAGEPSVTNNSIRETNTGAFTFSKQDGTYKLIVLDSGNLAVSSSLNYYNAVPVIHNDYFPGFQQIDSLNDFAFQPTGAFNDLCITITPMGNFRAGFDASYMINYENAGTTTLNATVIFFPDNDVTFVSSNVTPTSVTTDSVVWNVGTLTPFQTGSILVTVNVNIGTPIGTLINSNVRIEPVAGDNYPGCNYAYWEVYTIGSLDPNAILVDRDTVLTTELSSPPYLNYIIYFQNTGNDTAFNARVLNNIPQRLDVNSFEFVASSHPMNITYGAHARLMTFTFDNILLPDSNINEPASHGFIRYRIKPKSTLVTGNKINNKAFIYFDFNQPVMTNTAMTEIVLPTGEESFGFQVSGLWLYPNPAKDELIVNGRQLKDKGIIRIFDLFGREVYQLETRNQESETKIDVSGFSQGIYIIEMRAGEKVLRGKFVKQ